MMVPRRRTRIKFCGMTSPHDIALAVEAGADAVGLILAQSDRKVPLADIPAIVRSIPPFVTGVAVVAGDSAALAPAMLLKGLTIQFSGPEVPSVCERLSEGRTYIKAFHIRDREAYVPADFEVLEAYEHGMWMFDTAGAAHFGGSGVSFDWRVVEELARRRPIIVSGGLKAENVAACVRLVRPYAVDVRSGIETDGKKDPDRMCAFVRAVREADATA